ncbi:MAG: hypothetical protein KJ041_00270 [Gammaproteobacteria bacterium]|nr:hypothetical protein [Gammaproteobacteria bacterium]
MIPKWLDTPEGAEICEFNREFLRLLRESPAGGSAYGLDDPVRGRISALAPDQLEALAQTPCLLAGFPELPPRTRPGGVADAAGPAPRPCRSDAARVFAASLLTWLWHTAPGDRLVAALCIGPGRLAVERLRQVGLRDLQQAAVTAGESLEARFCHHPRLWPDLVRAVSQPGSEVLTAARLSVVQLTLIERVPVDGPATHRVPLAVRRL